MKALLYFLTCALLFNSLASSAQGYSAWSGDRSSFNLWNQWSVGLDAGLTSYFGDLSQFDQNPMKKFTKESHPALAFSLTKTWRNMDVSGELMYGGLQSDYKENHVFKTQIFEYNIQFGLHLLDWVAPHNSFRFELKPYAGIGQFIFNTIQYGSDEGQISEQSISKGLPEFVYFVGGRYDYELTNRINVSLNISVRQAQNDKLDNYVAGNNFDYYTFTSVGFRYSLNDVGLALGKHRLHRIQNRMKYSQYRKL